MRHKKMLAIPTHRYDKLPAWLMIFLACVMVELLFIVGQLVVGAIVSLLVISLAILISKGQTFIPFYDIVGSMYGLLGIFLFPTLLVFAWVKWYEKRSIRSLGFFKDKWFIELIKGWGTGTLMFTLTLGLSYLFGGLELTGVDFSLGTLFYVLSLIPFWLI